MSDPDGKTHYAEAEKPVPPVTVSVIIPFFNAERTLSRCIKSMLAVRSEDFEVILVNNNSTDHSALIAQAVAHSFPERFIYVDEWKQGPVFARNRGAAAARGRILAFIDADCLVSRQWLSALVNSFEDPQTGAVAGGISGLDGNTVFDKFHALFTFRAPKGPQIYHRFDLIRGGFPSANLAVRNEVFSAIGGFDPSLNLIAGEDYDLCARIYRKGFNIRFNPEAVVAHIHRNTLMGTWKQSYIFGTGHGLLLKRIFTRHVIVELPKYVYETEKIPMRAWINLASADKKLFVICLAAIIWWPMTALIALYLAFLFMDMKGRARKNNLAASSYQIWAMVALLVIKSFAMTLGRVDGAIRNRVLCF